MSRIITVTISIILMGVFALSSSAAAEHTIMATGKAEAKVKPDVAYVTLYAQADGILMVDAVKKADKLIEEITLAIKTKIDIVRNIMVEDIGLGEERRQYYSPNQKVEPPRPHVSRRIRISCKPEPKGIYEIIDEGIRAGALMQIPSTVSYPNDIRSVVIYGLEHSSEVIERVRRSAMKDAKVEAEKMAALAGKTVGDVIMIGGQMASQINSLIRIMGRTPDFPTEYVGTNPEEIIISNSVMVTFELKD